MCVWPCRTASSNAEPPNLSLRDHSVMIWKSKAKRGGIACNQDLLCSPIETRQCPDAPPKQPGAETSSYVRWRVRTACENITSNHQPSPLVVVCRIGGYSILNQSSHFINLASMCRLDFVIARSEKKMNFFRKVKWWTYLAHQNSCLLSWEYQDCSVLTQYRGHIVVTAHQQGHLQCQSISRVSTTSEIPATNCVVQACVLKAVLRSYVRCGLYQMHDDIQLPRKADWVIFKVISIPLAPWQLYSEPDCRNPCQKIRKSLVHEIPCPPRQQHGAGSVWKSRANLHWSVPEKERH